jgi:hypothetical protein
MLMNLAVTTPHNLWKLPANLFAETIDMDLSRASSDLKFEWFQPDTGNTFASGQVPGGKQESCRSGGWWVSRTQAISRGGK